MSNVLNFGSCDTGCDKCDGKTQQTAGCCESSDTCTHSRALELLTLIEAMKVTPTEHVEYLVGIAERELRGMIEMMELHQCNGCGHCEPRQDAPEVGLAEFGGMITAHLNH